MSEESHKQAPGEKCRSERRSPSCTDSPQATPILLLQQGADSPHVAVQGPLKLQSSPTEFGSHGNLPRRCGPSLCCLLESSLELIHRLEPVRGALFQALEDYRLEVARQRWHDFARPLRELSDLLQGYRHGSIAAKGWGAGYHFVEQQAHSVNVGAGIHGFEFRLLGGHVRRRANDGAGQRA